MATLTERMIKKVWYQYRNSPNFLAYLSCFLDELSDTEKVLDEVIAKRYYGTAEGVQLDVVGSLVGAERILKGVVLAGNFGYLQSAESMGMGREDDPSLGGPLRSVTDAGVEDIVLDDVLFMNWIDARIIKNNTACNIEDIITFFKLMLNNQATKIQVEEPAPKELRITIHAKLSVYDAALVRSLAQHIKPAATGFFVQDLRGEIKTLPVAYRRE
ncbi:structural protein [Shewanella phage SppYZU05]|uniref:Uncharacterized protein n=1 Tax=Shewanella phage SppYZU05 TaxID=1970795 RepID=A0A1W6JTC4_9CAUD|nr:structural protein [Shewanella phage SppYZU05]ARM70528.1 hypothetical protein SppYZU05_02 [Shewanella phage SppYZU05]